MFQPLGVFVGIGLITCGIAQLSTADENEIVARSQVSQGDLTRLQRVMTQARRGEPIVVGVIGGSITEGAAATTIENRWGNRVAQWWRERFPQTDITFVNAGIGATGSNLAAHRAEEHLLNHQPDFVVAEFGVNDENSAFAAETLEGLTRQILMCPNHPAMMLLFTMHRDGGNAQEWHGKVGEHYGLPMVSFRDALWPEIEAGRMQWEDVEADEVHPNDRGHQYCAEFISHLLDEVLANLPDQADLSGIPALPTPLLSNVYEHTALLNAARITPLTNQGWSLVKGRRLGDAWAAETPGDRLEFEVEATSIALIFHRVRGDMGIAEVQIDDRPSVSVNGWFDQTWGGYSAWQLIARDLAPGKHTLRITLSQAKSQASQGHTFELQAILIAGLPR